MKTKRSVGESDFAPQFAAACLGQCRKLTALLAAAKESLIAEFAETYDLSERLLRLVVNEAEALAWDTEYPHLVFPVLALEKVRVAANWQERQGVIRRVNPAIAFAA